MPPHAPAAFAAWRGLDWADANHDLCRPAAGAARRELLGRAPRPAALAPWLQPRRARCPGPPGAVGLELNKGPIVSARRPYEGLGRWPVHPFPLAQYRAAFPPSRATADPTAAALPGRTPPQTPRPAHPAPPPKGHEARLRTPRRTPPAPGRRQRPGPPSRAPGASKLRPPRSAGVARKRYGPLLGLLAPLAAAQSGTTRASPPLEPLCRAPHVRSADGSQPRIAAIKSAVALPPAPGRIPPHALGVPALGAQLRVPGPAITDVDTAIAAHAQDHPAVPVFDALPGAGAVWAPRLRVAFGAQRER
jgi:hypothetical protein